MRYRHVSARFLRTASPRQAYRQLAWDVTLVSLAPRTWRPAVDACESASELVVLVELAGVDEDDVDVTLFADALVVEGERRVEACLTDGRYDIAEIRQGPFRLEVALPFPVDADHVSADYERGLLRILLPRPAATRRRRTRRGDSTVRAR